ncbi:MAG: VanW family protein [Lachnospiraceae bacterium]|nr:VanW family protein [bacterium]MDY5517155.1 VanW family protein [Lachnospiraceae bacterium]
MKNKKLNLGWKLGGALVAAVVCAAGIYVGITAHAQENGEHLIADNIYIGDIAVGGMTEVQANEAVDAYVESLGDTQFTLTVDGKSVTATAADFGVTWSNPVIIKDAANVGKTGNLIERYKSKKDLEHENLVFDIAYTADREKVKSFLEEHTQDMNQDAVNYGLVRENGGFRITDGQNGVAVDVDRSADEIVSYIEDTWTQTNTSLELAASVVEPEGTKEQLARVKDVLGTYTTDFGTSSAGRAQNVRNGAGKINGRVLYPGEQFSVYEAVNPFTAENGYELAGSYENGTTVQTYGGGICQVSTTLYNAVIRAELAIDERFCHSMIVSYVQPSMDAAIAGTYKDLKFTNNYDFPVYIEGYTSGMQITFTIYGEETRPAGREVSFESETTSTTEPETKFEAVADQPIGYIQQTQSAHTGYTAKLWKIVKENGVEVSREPYNNSTYNASPRIIAVGIKSDNAEAVAAVKAAIASGNESTIRAVAAANSAEALKKQEEEEKKQEEEQKKQEEEEKEKEQEQEQEEEKKPAKKEEAQKPVKESEETTEE